MSQFEIMQMSLQDVKDRLMSDTPDLVETQCLLIAVINAIQRQQNSIDFQCNQAAVEEENDT